jgi:hypothetical protein
LAVLAKGAAPFLAAGACSARSKITRSASRRDFHDREDFYIEKRSKSFAIMKDGRLGEATGVPGQV